METGLCPRCGSRVWFLLGMLVPYCNECGWNLDELYKGRHKNDRTFKWVACAIATLTCVPVIIHDPGQGLLLLGGFLVLSFVLVFLVGQSKPNRRLQAARRVLTGKPGTDLSSSTPSAMPPQVFAYGEELRSIPAPRKVRLVWARRAVIWFLRLIAAILAFAAIRDLLFPQQRIVSLSGGVLPAVLLLIATLVWFVIPIPLRKEPRLDLLVSGEIAMARTAAVPAPWWKGEQISFEFHDAKGRLIRSQSVNRGYPPAVGAYLPVFHNPQDPENCALACALNYEIVLPQSLRFPRPKP